MTLWSLGFYFSVSDLETSVSAYPASYLTMANIEIVYLRN